MNTKKVIPRWQDELIELRVPATIYDVYAHPLLSFSVDSLATDLENAADLNLSRIPIFHGLLLGETKTATIAIADGVATIYRQVSTDRDCSVETLMNSALAVWLEDYWYDKGKPRGFQQICKRILMDTLGQNGEDPLWRYILEILETHRRP